MAEKKNVVQYGSTATQPSSSRVSMANVVSPASVRAQGTVAEERDTTTEDFAKASLSLLSFFDRSLEQHKQREFEQEQLNKKQAWEAAKELQKRRLEEAQGQQISSLYADSMDILNNIVKTPESENMNPTQMRLKAMTKISKHMTSSKFSNMTPEQRLSFMGKLNTDFDDMLQSETKWGKFGAYSVSLNALTGETQFKGNTQALVEGTMTEYLKDKPHLAQMIASTKTDEERQALAQDIATRAGQLKEAELQQEMTLTALKIKGQNLSNTKKMREVSRKQFSDMFVTNMFGGEDTGGDSFSGAMDIAINRVKQGVNPAVASSDLKNEIKTMYLNNPAMMEMLSNQGISAGTVDSVIENSLGNVEKVLEGFDPKRTIKSDAAYEKDKFALESYNTFNQLSSESKALVGLAEVTDNSIVGAAVSGKVLKDIQEISFKGKKANNRVGDLTVERFNSERSEEQVRTDLKETIVPILRNLNSGEFEEINGLDLFNQIKVLQSYKRSSNYDKLPNKAKGLVEQTLSRMKNKIETTESGKTVSKKLFNKE